MDRQRYDWEKPTDIHECVRCGKRSKARDMERSPFDDWECQDYSCRLGR